MDKTRVSGRMQKLHIPVSVICRPHETAIEAELKAVMGRDLQKIIRAWTARKRVIKAEGDLLAQCFRNRAETRSKVDNQSMAAARRGQVEADARRAELIFLMTKTRTKLAEATISAAIQSRPRSLMHTCLRFVAPQGD